MELTPPARRLTRKEKNANNYQYFKEVANYYIRNTSFPGLNHIKVATSSEISRDTEIESLIGLYNNDVPTDWFKHMTEPVTGEKGFMPAKIRPLNILKPNIDYLISSYGKRPLQYTVVNSEESSYNNFVEEQKKYKDSVIQQRFIQTMKNGEQQDNTPEKLIDDFALNYKDALAVKAQVYMDEIIQKYDLHEKFKELFLNYAIHGNPVSFRGIKNGKLSYRVVNAKTFAYGGTGESNYIEDAPYCVEYRQLTLNEAADELYEEITEDQWKEIDDKATFSPLGIRSLLQGNNPSDRFHGVYHIYFQALKKQGTIYETDEYGKVQEIKVDEDYEGPEEITWSWIPQIYKINKWGTDLYTGIGELPFAISDVNSFNSCKLPYNGINFGYKTNKVFSPLKMGVPYLVMYLICNFQIEKLLAKHKGKLLLLDVNVIPKTDGWNEKKFIKYLESMGYMFINRNQIGVDKSFNQYSSIDMSTLGDVNSLIQLCDYYKGQWDDIIGIPRQMRGQTYASDQVGNTRAAITQSGVTIDYIYQKFEDFIKHELQYLIELAKFMTINGYKTLIDKDDYGSELLNIEPGELFANLGIKVTNSSQELDELNAVKEYAKSVNQQDPIAIVGIMTSRNIAQLKKTLNKIQRNQQQNQQAGEEQQHQNAMEIEAMKESLLRLENDLKKDYMQAEYIEKRELEYIQGEIELATATTLNADQIPDTNNNGMKNIDDIIENSRNRLSQERIKDKELQFKNKELAVKERMNKENNKTMLANKVVGERNKSKK